MHFVALVAFCYLFFVFGVFCDKEECSTKNETEKSESECDFKSKLDKLKAKCVWLVIQQQKKEINTRWCKTMSF